MIDKSRQPIPEPQGEQSIKIHGLQIFSIERDPEELAYLGVPDFYKTDQSVRAVHEARLPPSRCPSYIVEGSVGDDGFRIRYEWEFDGRDGGCDFLEWEGTEETKERLMADLFFDLEVYISDSQVYKDAWEAYDGQGT